MDPRSTARIRRPHHPTGMRPDPHDPNLTARCPPTTGSNPSHTSTFQWHQSPSPTSSYRARWRCPASGRIGQPKPRARASRFNPKSNTRKGTPANRMGNFSPWLRQLRDLATWRSSATDFWKHGEELPKPESYVARVKHVHTIHGAWWSTRNRHGDPNAGLCACRQCDAAPQWRRSAGGSNPVAPTIPSPQLHTRDTRHPPTNPPGLQPSPDWWRERGLVVVVSVSSSPVSLYRGGSRWAGEREGAEFYTPTREGNEQQPATFMRLDFGRSELDAAQWGGRSPTRDPWGWGLCWQLGPTQQRHEVWNAGVECGWMAGRAAEDVGPHVGIVGRIGWAGNASEMGRGG
jgi:hypothetical protein